MPRRLTGIVIEGDDLTFYFEDSDEPWGIEEFLPDTPTRNGLEKIEAAVIDFNFQPKKGEQDSGKGGESST